MKAKGHKMSGWLALSPLLVFLAIYLAGSIIARDFYKVPVAAAFIIASAYAFFITQLAKFNRLPFSLIYYFVIFAAK